VEGKEPPSKTLRPSTLRSQKIKRTDDRNSCVKLWGTLSRERDNTPRARQVMHAASHNRTAKPVSQAPPAPAPRLLLGAPPVRSLAVLLARALADGDEARLDGLDGAPSAAVVALRGEAPGRWVGCGCGCCEASVV